jgi:hypothetical protein
LCARVCVWRFAAKIQNDLRILTERLARINDNLARKVSSRTEYDKTITETEAAYSKIMESSQTLLHVLKRESVNLTKKKQGSSWACGVASAQALRGRSACSSLGAPSRVHGDKTALPPYAAAEGVGDAGRRQLAGATERLFRALESRSNPGAALLNLS